MVGAVAVAAFVTSCSTTVDHVVADAVTDSVGGATEEATTPTALSMTNSTPSPSTTTTTATTPPDTTTTMAPKFDVIVHEIDEAAAARMTLSWRDGCPVPLEDLRLLEVSHHNFEGGVTMGEVVVHEEEVGAMISAFEALFDLRYPIEQMRLVDEFAADDMVSMQANNTSAFNCRFVAGTSRWSEHAFGRAIDLNPLINPYVQGERISPLEGAPYANRAQDIPGLIRSDDEVVKAFAAAGWLWGGYWSSSKDYQHFSATGQ